MRLVTFTQAGSTRTGALNAAGDVIDLHAADATIPTDMLTLLAGGDAMLDRARAAASKAGATIAASDVTLEAPIPNPRSVLAIGVNYRDHAQEAGHEMPQHPVVFAKVATCITGPGKPVHMPSVSKSVDWEGELCFVMGKAAHHVSAADALSYVAGYMIGNDVSVRDWQFHAPTWIMGKGFDTHGPIGPWLVTRDEVDPGSLDIATYVNGEEKQHSNTKHLIFGIPQIIEYLTTAFTLRPGDVVFTGTPAGVGVSRKPPQFLKAGDTVRIEISGLGTLENRVIDEPA
jgi:2-keto-4-pentenoate hydratase/2-oxohepta-3-ene-1,7-dioic acid hydratase in catechol pathway